MVPPIEKMYTNKFIGTVKLDDAEWKTVEVRSGKYLPRTK
jgi:hypothetical protein